MQRFLLSVTTCLALSVTGLQAADDKKVDVTGTWKWSITFGDQTRDFTMKLKQDADKVSGTMSGPGGQDTKIDDGKIKDGEITFSVTRERNGEKFTVKYKGKVSGDSIEGKMDVNFGGQEQSFDWKPKKEKAEKKE